MLDLYFAQFTDLHVGMRGHCAEFDFAERHLTHAKAKGQDAFTGEDAVPVTFAREPREQPLDQREILFTLWGKPVVSVEDAR